MKIGNFSLWTSAAEAVGWGATHHARIFGIVPGFARVDGGLLWVPRSDALNWLEDALSFFAAVIQSVTGAEAMFLRIGREIEL